MSLTPILAAAGCAAALAVGAVAGVAVAGTSAGAAAANRPAAAAADPLNADLAALDTADPVAAVADDASLAAAAGRGRVGPRLCARIPQALTRTQTLQTRLAGSASTKGSLAWLQTRIDAAQGAGHTQLAQVLTDRRKMLTDLQPVLADRLTMLHDAQQLCGAAGSTDAPSGTGSSGPAGTSGTANS